MTTKKDMIEWDAELHELAKSFGEGDKSAWLIEYGDLKQKILDECSFSRYANGLGMSDLIIGMSSGYEYLAIIFTKMKLLDDVMRGLIEKEDK